MYGQLLDFFLSFARQYSIRNKYIYNIQFTVFRILRRCDYSLSPTLCAVCNVKRCVHSLIMEGMRMICLMGSIFILFFMYNIKLPSYAKQTCVLLLLFFFPFFLEILSARLPFSFVVVVAIGLIFIPWALTVRVSYTTTLIYTFQIPTARHFSQFNIIRLLWTMKIDGIE